MKVRTNVKSGIAGGAGAGGVVMVQSNPIYQGAGTSGSNPLHRSN